MGHENKYIRLLKATESPNAVNTEKVIALWRNAVVAGEDDLELLAQAIELLNKESNTRWDTIILNILNDLNEADRGGPISFGTAPRLALHKGLDNHFNTFIIRYNSRERKTV